MGNHTMHKEQFPKNLEILLKKEKLPLLIRELYLTFIEQPQGYKSTGRLLAAEINDIIEQVYGNDATHYPHYRITNQQPFEVEQYFPFIENKKFGHGKLYYDIQTNHHLFHPDTTLDYKGGNQITYDPTLFFDSSLIQTLLGTIAEEPFSNEEEFGDDDYGDGEVALEYLDGDEDYEEIEPGELIVAWSTDVKKGQIRVEVDVYDGSQLRVVTVLFTNENLVFLKEFGENLSSQGSTVTAIFSKEDYLSGLVVPMIPGRPDTPVDPRLN